MKIHRTFRPLMAMKPPTIGPLHQDIIRPEYTYHAEQSTYKDGPAKLPIDHSDITIPRSFGDQISVTMVPLVAIGPLEDVRSAQVKSSYGHAGIIDYPDLRCHSSGKEAAYEERHDVIASSTCWEEEKHSHQHLPFPAAVYSRLTSIEYCIQCHESDRRGSSSPSLGGGSSHERTDRVTNQENRHNETCHFSACSVIG